MTWSFWEWTAWGILAAVGFWILSTLLDMGLDWLLQRHVRQELDALNKQPLPVRIIKPRESGENDRA